MQTMKKENHPSEAKLFRLVVKGYRSKSSLASTILGIILLVLQSVSPSILGLNQEQLHNAWFWVVLVLEIILLGICIFFDIKNFCKFDKEPFTKALDNLRDLFNTAIMSNAEARINMFVQIQHRKGDPDYYKFYSTDSSDIPYHRPKGDLTCFGVFKKGTAIIKNLTEEEKAKSTRSGIESIFAFPIENKKHKVVAVISIDTKKKIEECNAIKNNNITDEKEINNILEKINTDLQSICNHYIQHILAKG